MPKELLVYRRNLPALALVDRGKGDSQHSEWRYLQLDFQECVDLVFSGPLAPRKDCEMWPGSVRAGYVMQLVESGRLLCISLFVGHRCWCVPDRK